MRPAKLTSLPPAFQRQALEQLARQDARRKGPESPEKEKKKRRGVMNGTERAYAAHLTAQGRPFHFEGIKLRLADDAWFTCDFAVWVNGAMEFHETKGFMREAAAVRLKTAAEQYPQFVFRLVRLVKGSWNITEVPSRARRLAEETEAARNG